MTTRCCFYTDFITYVIASYSQYFISNFIYHKIFQIKFIFKNKFLNILFFIISTNINASIYLYYSVLIIYLYFTI